MKKAIIVLLTVLLTLSVFVACDEGNMIDEKFTSTITFDANGGEGEMKAQVVVSNTPVKLAENTFTKEDFHFHGWSTNPDGTGTTYGDGEEITVTGSITLYAIWNHDMAIISFNANGGEGLMKLQYVPTNTPTALRPNEFTREDYEFMYWTTEASGEGDAYGDEAKISISKSITLYAQWKQNLVPITFHANNGSDPETTKVQNVEPGVSTALNANTFSKTGYFFYGWTETAQSTTVKYKDGDPITTSEAVDLFAIWSANTYKVSFNANGGSGTAMPDQTFTYDVENNLTANTYTKDNYDFTGWATTSTGTVAYTDGQAVKNLTSEDKSVVTLYAVWKGIPYTVKFNVTDSATGTMTDQSFNYDVAQKLTKNTFVRTGYSFAGWATTSGGAKAYDDEQSVSNLTKTKNATVNLYTTWTANSYTVKFDSNGGTGTMADQSFTYDTDQSLTANGFTAPSGKYFGGWATSSEGEIAYSNKQSVKNLIDTGSITLYAIWTDTPPITIIKNTEGTLTLTSGDYTIEENTTVTVGGRITIDGTVNLLLPDDSILNADSGITVTTGNTLVIDKYGSTAAGTGILTAVATGVNNAAGIGGVYDAIDANKRNAGTITINGGTVNANGGAGAAGIGGGYVGAGGTVTITGGIVTATGGTAGAGIGSGDSGSTGGTVTINGGTVTATGGSNDAVGIGVVNGTSSHGDLTIADDVIMMVSTNNTDWSVYDGSTRTQYMKVPEPIVLTSSTTEWASGNVYTLGDEDVEIASRITVTGSVGLILPKDKTLTASSGITVNSGNSLTIGGSGEIFATGTEDKAGIGAGNGSTDHGTLTIGAGCALTGGSASADTLLLGPVDEKTTYTGASHPRYMNVSTVLEIKDSTSAITLKSGVYTTDKDDPDVVIVSERITVEGSVFLFLPDGTTLTASKGITVSSGNTLAIDKYGSKATGKLIAGGAGTTSQHAAGIGGGGWSGTVGTVTINGGTVRATGGFAGAGIGGGWSGTVGTVTINGGTVEAIGGEGAAGIGGGYEGAGGTVTINGGTVTANGGNYAAGIGRGYDGGSDGTLTIGENSTTPYTDGKLRIASGWTLCYGESSASESIGAGTYDSWSGYAKKYMNVTQP